MKNDILHIKTSEEKKYILKSVAFSGFWLRYNIRFHNIQEALCFDSYNK